MVNLNAKNRQLQERVDKLTAESVMWWELKIEDPDRVINRNVIGLGSIFNIMVGHQDIIHGHCKAVDTHRDANGLTTYVFGGYNNIDRKTFEAAILKPLKSKKKGTK